LAIAVKFSNGTRFSSASIRTGMLLMPRAPANTDVCVFETRLRWMAIAGARGVLRALTFGHPTPKGALAALHPDLTDGARMHEWNPSLIRRLHQFADGERVEFDDLELDLDDETPFAQRVIARCRAIPYGGRMTYGELAETAGAPGAARAVGSVMRRNRTPLVVPCHRVVAAGARLGGYSGADGVRTKLRLLEAEARLTAPQRERRPRLRSSVATPFLSA
jgi:methylated-DNA-[protein]-cysteine S-methyltransferase